MPLVHNYEVEVLIRASVTTKPGATMELLHDGAAKEVMEKLEGIRDITIVKVQVTKK